MGFARPQRALNGRRRLVGLAVTPIFLATLTPIDSIAQPPCSAPLAPAVAYPFGSNPHGIAAADFTGDGILDLAVSNSALFDGSPNVTVFPGLSSGGIATGTFGPGTTHDARAEPFGLRAADFNGDGILDIVVANFGNDLISVLIGEGGGEFANPVPYFTGIGPWDIALGDFNADDILDLAVSCNGRAEVSIMIGGGSSGTGDGTFTQVARYNVGGLPTDIVADDFNQDGITDLAVARHRGGGVAVLIGLGNTPGVGDGTFGGALVYPGTAEPFSLTAADFDQDGIPDLVCGDGGNGGVAFLRGLSAGGGATGTFGFPVLSENGIPGGGLESGDWTGDGIPDLAVAGGIENAVIVMGGFGDGTFATIQTEPVGALPVTITSADLNEDGARDIAVCNFESGGISVLLADCVGEFPPPPPPSPNPVLDAVLDVPNDQGGRVFVSWFASALDDPQLQTITGYRVWRRKPPATAGPLKTSARGITWTTTTQARADGAVDVFFWEALITLPAEGLSGYAYEAPTTQDSMRHSNPYTAFFVSALTADPFVFFQSDVDSGYSVDNLPPRGPGHLAGTRVAEGYELEWEAAEDPDIREYRIHRGVHAEFPTDETTRIAAVAALGYLDPEATGEHWYKVVAVDLHENEGPAAVLAPLVEVGTGTPALGFALHRIAPNPVTRTAIDVAFAVPVAGSARIDLIGVDGRRVAWREMDDLQAGQHHVQLRVGPGVPQGVYFVRLVQDRRTAMQRVTVLR